MASLYDIVIVGGGPAGLAAALNLGRARRRVLLCDAGPRRNAAADRMHAFVTQDGTPPATFRRIARQQLAAYPNVHLRDAGVAEIRGESGAFDLSLTDGTPVAARRVLLCTGMIDVLPAIDGFDTLWGRSIVICPYCHGWEVQDRRFGFLAPAPDGVEFALFLRGWSRDIVMLTDGRFAVDAEARERLARGGVRLDERRIARVIASDDQPAQLHALAFTEGDPLPLDVLFARPPQRQVALVDALVASHGLELDASGYVRVDGQQTSIRGIYAAGDLLTRAQSAILAAAAGVQAAAMINHELALQMEPTTSPVTAG